jgi:hypothetical protein
MKHITMSLATALFLAGLAIAVSVPASAETNTYFGFQIGIGNAPPPPQVVYTSPPQMDRERGSRVSYLRDDPGYDMFHYGKWYYMNSNGNWYRSRNYRGPFVSCDVRRVPRQVFSVPDQRWHHRHQGERPGQMNHDQNRQDGNQRNDRNQMPQRQDHSNH